MNFHDPKKQLEGLHGELSEKKAKGAGYTTDIALPKTFWDKPLGRTLRGKNRTGKILYAAAGAAVSIITGINIEPVTGLITDNQTIDSMDLLTDFFADINLWSIFFLLIAVLFGYLRARAGSALAAVYQQAQIGFTMWSDFKKEESDGGRKVTDAEKDQLINQLGKIIEAIIGVIRPQRFGRSND